MICEKCGIEYSDSVYPYHFERCEIKVDTKDESDIEKDENEVREKAKELGIKNYWNKNIETLLAEILEKER